MRMLSKDVASLPRDRTTHRYDPLLTWCEWILAMASPAMSAGATQAPGLLFDMNKLFEAHVAKREEDGAGPDRIVHKQGPPLHLGVRGATDVFLLKPDITVWKVDQNGAASGIDRVVDAKWKRLNPAVPDYGVDEADVYQLLAYAMRYGCSALELVYPMPDGLVSQLPPPAFKISTAGDDQNTEIVVTVKLIPLWTRDMSTPSMQDPRLTEAETEFAST